MVKKRILLLGQSNIWVIHFTYHKFQIFKNFERLNLELLSLWNYCKIKSLKRKIYMDLQYAERRLEMVNKAIIVSNSRCSILQEMAFQLDKDRCMRLSETEREWERSEMN